MPTAPGPVLLAYEAWDDLDKTLAGLTPEEATTRRHGGSSVAWTLGHVTHMVDSWINMRFQGMPAHPVIADARFRSGGSGDWDDWEGVLDAVHDVWATARAYLDSGPDPDTTVPYSGSIAFLHETGLRLSYALTRIAAHHLMHAGEIAALRSHLGHDADQLFRPEWGRRLA